MLSSTVRVAPVKDRIDLDDLLVGLCEKHAPVTNPKAKNVLLSLYAFDVTGACCGVPLDAFNDAVTCLRVEFLEVAARPIGETRLHGQSPLPL